MEKIYSKIDDDKLLHIVVRLDDFKGRTEIVPENNFIQCAALKMPKDKTFPPHKHITKERTYKEQIAQESWVVITGKVRCILYDTDDTVIATPILEAGDASFTLYGGHTYEILEEDTIVYEYKTGPYEGQQLDKEFIDA
jgi:cupin fold WbuC family metalloprotein|tara:strand:+ start:7176 stop:7592 length:417 start_codon:yes stop_codon:yes gene_type:complete